MAEAPINLPRQQLLQPGEETLLSDRSRLLANLDLHWLQLRQLNSGGFMVCLSAANVGDPPEWHRGPVWSDLPSACAEMAGCVSNTWDLLIQEARRNTDILREVHLMIDKEMRLQKLLALLAQRNQAMTGERLLQYSRELTRRRQPADEALEHALQTSFAAALEEQAAAHASPLAREVAASCLSPASRAPGRDRPAVGGGGYGQEEEEKQDGANGEGDAAAQATPADMGNPATMQLQTQLVQPHAELLSAAFKVLLSSTRDQLVDRVWLIQFQELGAFGVRFSINGESYQTGHVWAQVRHAAAEYLRRLADCQSADLCFFMEQLRHTSPEERQYHLRELQEAHKQEVEEMKLRLLCLVEELDSQHEAMSADDLVKCVEWPSSDTDIQLAEAVGLPPRFLEHLPLSTCLSSAHGSPSDQPRVEAHAGPDTAVTHDQHKAPGMDMSSSVAAAVPAAAAPLPTAEQAPQMDMPAAASPQGPNPPSPAAWPQAPSPAALPRPLSATIATARRGQTSSAMHDAGAAAGMSLDKANSATARPTVEAAAAGDTGRGGQGPGGTPGGTAFAAAPGTEAGSPRAASGAATAAAVAAAAAPAALEGLLGVKRGSDAGAAAQPSKRRHIAPAGEQEQQAPDAGAADIRPPEARSRIKTSSQPQQGRSASGGLMRRQLQVINKVMASSSGEGLKTRTPSQSALAGSKARTQKKKKRIPLQPLDPNTSKPSNVVGTSKAKATTAAATKSHPPRAQEAAAAAAHDGGVEQQQQQQGLGPDSSAAGAAAKSGVCSPSSPPQEVQVQQPPAAATKRGGVRQQQGPRPDSNYAAARTALAAVAAAAKGGMRVVAVGPPQGTQSWVIVRPQHHWLNSSLAPTSGPCGAAAEELEAKDQQQQDGKHEERDDLVVSPDERDVQQQQQQPQDQQPQDQQQRQDEEEGVPDMSAVGLSGLQRLPFGQQELHCLTEAATEVCSCAELDIRVFTLGGCNNAHIVVFADEGGLQYRGLGWFRQYDAELEFRERLLHHKDKAAGLRAFNAERNKKRVVHTKEIKERWARSAADDQAELLTLAFMQRAQSAWASMQAAAATAAAAAAAVAAATAAAAAVCGTKRAAHGDLDSAAQPKRAKQQRAAAEGQSNVAPPMSPLEEQRLRLQAWRKGSQRDLLHLVSFEYVPADAATTTLEQAAEAIKQELLRYGPKKEPMLPRMKPLLVSPMPQPSDGVAVLVLLEAPEGVPLANARRVMNNLCPAVDDLTAASGTRMLRQQYISLFDRTDLQNWAAASAEHAPLVAPDFSKINCYHAGVSRPLDLASLVDVIGAPQLGSS